MAELSWLGNLWDEITGQSKKPGIQPEGLLSGTITPEYTPLASEIGLLARNVREVDLPVMGEHLKRNIPAVVASVPGAAVDIFNLPTAAREYAVRSFRGEPTDQVEFFPASTESYDLARQGMIGLLGEAPAFPNVQTQAATTAAEMLTPIPVTTGPRAIQATRNVANRAAEAVERSPLGQGILGLQEQRGMGDGLLGTPKSQILAGPGSATADMPALLKANQLELEGTKPQKIFEQTGWYKDIDDQWKYEIPDKIWTPGDMITPEDVMLKGIPKVGPPTGSKLDDILSHKRLYEAYPEAKNIQFEYDPKYGSGAAFVPGRTLSDSKIVIGDDIFDNDLAMQRILHEVQHGVQSFEGFAVGGNPKVFAKELNRQKQDVLDLVRQTNTALSKIVKDKDQLKSQFVPSDDPRILDLDRRYQEGLRYRANLVDSFKYWDSTDLEEEAISRYKSLAGEVEARNVPRRAKDQGLLGIIPTETTKGDIPKGYQSIEFEPTVMESSGLLDYAMRHRPPEREVGNTLDDLSNIYPDDLYSSKGWMYYGVGGSPAQQRMDTVSANILAKVRGKPDAEVTIYRAVPKGVKDFNEGDWVTINREYAKEHGEGPLKGDYDIISKKVKASELTTEGNSLHEQGYWPLED